MFFTIAQIIGITSLLIYCIGIQVKKKEKVLLVSVLTNFLGSFQYLLLGAITGFVTFLINAIRCLAFYNYEKRYSKTSKSLLIIFILIILICGKITYKDVFSILPITSSIISTYGMWQSKVMVTRIGLLVSCALLIIYSIQTQAYAGALTFTIMFVSTLVSIIRNDINFKKRIKTEIFKNI